LTSDGSLRSASSPQSRVNCQWISSIDGIEQFPNPVDRADQERLRDLHAEKERKPLLSLEAARANPHRVDFSDVPVPEFTGRREVEVDLATLRDYIDWQFFFHAWELKGKYPAILDNPAARELFDDATELLDEALMHGEHLVDRQEPDPISGQANGLASRFLQQPRDYPRGLRRGPFGQPKLRQQSLIGAQSAFDAHKLDGLGDPHRPRDDGGDGKPDQHHLHDNVGAEEHAPRR
jgi:hypothetical protein